MMMKKTLASLLGRLTPKKKESSFPHELIGEEVEVIASANKHDVGIQGKIVDETKSTIKVLSNSVVKTLLKNIITLKMLPSGRIIGGENISRRPEDRIKIK